MKALLDNRFAPITFTWGFVESPFAQVSEVFVQWQTQLDEKFGSRTERKSFWAPLSESLFSLEPLTTPLDRYLLTETSSIWTAIFGNGLRVNDVHSPVSYLSRLLKRRGLEVTSIPDRSENRSKDALRVYGAVVFALYGPEQIDRTNRVRRVAVTNDVSGWEFAANGEVQPYEQTENYRKRNIVDRFTPQMLESYCAALGIELFNPDFYGAQSLLVHTRRTLLHGPTMSIAEARSHLHIPRI